ncbi:hypothetical protein FRB95_014454 [Tulasnella sp. JGI-2019a]|nr:hypothetical protein FRB95_014454 [Tulasnella sp. JGI-2019a]
MLAAVRIDLGNVLPNNFLVNHSIPLIKQTISPSAEGNGESLLYGNLTNAWKASNYPGLRNISANTPPSQITVQYQCQVVRRKSIGAIFVSVTVATVTLFQGGWAMFMLGVIFLAKKEG